MQTLEELTREAAALGTGAGAGEGARRVIPIRGLTDDEAEVSRVMHICNACRYCEGFCAVFPAMTRRLEFGAADIHYLANLCHNCGACLHACQYAPPHEFAVNVPQALAHVRLQTYTAYAWPAALGALYRRNGLTLSLALVAGLTLFLALAIALKGPLWSAPLGGSFYALFPHNLMVALFAPIFLFAVLALTLGVRRFWRDEDPGPTADESRGAALAEAASDALSLKYLGGGHGEGCNNEDDAFTLWRRRMHHLTFYGFVLCFGATSVATLWHYLFGWEAPYGFTSLPKLLGIPGGLSLALGSAGLFWLNLRRYPSQQVEDQKPMDRGFIALLFLTAASGLALMALRQTPALALLLCLHLGAVMALFATMPYGKFAHGIFRSAALVKFAIEKRRASGVQAGSE